MVRGECPVADVKGKLLGRGLYYLHIGAGAAPGGDMPRSCVIGRVRLGRYVLSDAIPVSLLQDDIVNKCRVVEEAVEFQTPVTNIQGKNRLW